MSADTEELLAALKLLAQDHQCGANVYVAAEARWVHFRDFAQATLASAEQAHAAKDSPTLQARADISHADLVRIVDRVVSANPEHVEGVIANPRNIGWFFGRVMKDTDGAADPVTIFGLIADRLFSAAPARPSTLQDEGVRAALERARDFITAQSPIAADEAILQALDALSRGEAAEPELVGPIKGDGFVSGGPGAGGFSHITIGDRKFTAQEVRRALSAPTHHHEAGGAPVRSTYWFLENPHGEWLVDCRDNGDPRWTKDHTEAWKFKTREAADAFRHRQISSAWIDEWHPTEHADEPAVQAGGAPGRNDEEALERVMRAFLKSFPSDVEPNDETAGQITFRQAALVRRLIRDVTRLRRDLAWTIKASKVFTPCEPDVEAPSDHQGREQVIGELCEAAEDLKWKFYRFMVESGVRPQIAEHNVGQIDAALAKARSAQ